MNNLIKSIRSISLLVTALIFSVVADCEEIPKLIPIEAFYQMPNIRNVVLSPDGNYIAAIKNMDDTSVVMTLNLATGTPSIISKTDNKDFKFSWIGWGTNDRLLVSVKYSDKVRGWDKMYTTTRLLSFDAHTAAPPLQLKVTAVNTKFVSQIQDRVLSTDPNDENAIFLAIEDATKGYPAVFKFNIYTGANKVVKKSQPPINGWVLDAQGNVRVAESYSNDKSKVEFKVLNLQTNDWVDAWEYRVHKDPEISVLGFGKNPNELYLLADNNGTRALYKADLSKVGFPRELLLANENYDINGGLIFSESLKDVVGFRYSVDGEEKNIFWNEEFKKFQSGLEKALPDASPFISSMSKNGRKYVVFTHGTTDPGVYFIGDRDNKKLTRVFERFPGLDSNVLVDKQRITYKARDGLEIEAYLSVPKNSSGKNLPTIILPHGGPMVEEVKQFDAFSAFFVSRGYAVLQPNFRGSAGRGFAFKMEAIGKMGLKMQDDLEDGLDYLISQNITDSKKTCIVGGSYGGYAALMGAVKTPDRFQCAISFAGISDLLELRRNSAIYMNSNAIKEQIGTDDEQLKNTSPINGVDKIKIPILLIHGSDDAVVSVNQSREMAKMLKEKKKVYEYVELAKGSHNLDSLVNRKETFEAMDVFLKKYLPVE